MGRSAWLLDRAQEDCWIAKLACGTFWQPWDLFLLTCLLMMVCRSVKWLGHAMAEGKMLPYLSRYLLEISVEVSSSFPK